MKLSASMIGACALLACGSANAADLYSNGGYKDSASAAAVSNFGGFYIGPNIGYGFSADRSNVTPSFTEDGSTTAIPFSPYSAPFSNGIFGGAQAGFNVQKGAFVAGIETDIQYADINGSSSTLYASSLPPHPPVDVTAVSKQDLDWFGTVRGRLGVVVGPVLLYGTGGFAYGDVNDRLAGRFTLGTGSDATAYSVTVKHDSIRTGYVVGGGAEWLINPHWSVKAEYQYLDFGSEAIRAGVISPVDGALLGSVSTSKIDATYHTARIGVNYHVGDIRLPLN